MHKLFNLQSSEWHFDDFGTVDGAARVLHVYFLFAINIQPAIFNIALNPSVW